MKKMTPLASKTQQRAFSAPWQTTNHSGDGIGNASQKSFVMAQKWASPFSRIGTQKEAEVEMPKSSLQYSQGSQKQIASKLLQNFQVAPYPPMVASPDLVGIGKQESEQILEKLDALHGRIDDLCTKIDESEKYCAARAQVSQQILVRRLESGMARRMTDHAFLDGIAKRVCHYMHENMKPFVYDTSKERMMARMDDKVTSLNSRMVVSTKHACENPRKKQRVRGSSLGVSHSNNVQ